MARRNEPPSGPLVVDSSCWLEVFDGGARAALFEPVVGRPRVRAAGSSAAPASSLMPSRTVMTFAQFLQRILRILPRTRSSAIE